MPTADDVSTTCLLHLADSELAWLREDGPDLLLRLSAARVDRPPRADEDRPQPAYARGVLLRLVGAVQTLDAQARAAVRGTLPGRVRDGRWQLAISELAGGSAAHGATGGPVNGPAWCSTLPLPSRHDAPVVLELAPALTDPLRLEAAALVCSFDGEARLVDALFC